MHLRNPCGVFRPATLFLVLQFNNLGVELCVRKTPITYGYPDAVTRVIKSNHGPLPPPSTPLCEFDPDEVYRLFMEGSYDKMPDSTQKAHLDAAEQFLKSL